MRLTGKGCPLPLLGIIMGAIDAGAARRADECHLPSASRLPYRYAARTEGNEADEDVYGGVIARWRGIGDIFVNAIKGKWSRSRSLWHLWTALLMKMVWGPFTSVKMKDTHLMHVTYHLFD